jgi:hypothetical protein
VLPLFNFDRPVRLTRVFTTLRDNQPKALFLFLWRERSRPAWYLAGRIVLDGLAPAPAGRPSLELTLSPGETGDVLIELADRTTGRMRRFLMSSSHLFSRREPARRLETDAITVSADDGGERGEPKGFGRFKTAGLVAIGIAAAAGLVFLFLFVAYPRMQGIRPGVTTPAVELAHVSEAPRTPREIAIPASAAEEDSAGGGGKDGAGSRERTDSAGERSGGAGSDTMSGASPKADGGEEVQPEEVRAEDAPVVRVQAEEPPRGVVEEGTVAADALSHRIQWGDTLWRITERYYGNPRLYPLLAVENEISNPNLLIPGTNIRLPRKIDEQERKD